MEQDAKSRAVDGAIEQLVAAVRKSLNQSLRPVLEQVFDAGQIENMAALQRAMHQLPVQPPTTTPMTPPAAATSGTPGKDGRAPRGSIRKIVIPILVAAPPEGLTAAEIVAGARKVDPSLSSGGVHNELNRQKGRVYVNEEGRWRLMPGLSLGGEYYDLLDQNPGGDEGGGALTS